MAKDYSVLIDNEEGNAVADVLSLTGRVNGINVAAKVRISMLAKMDAKHAKREKQKALIAAFESRQESPASAAGEKVTL